MNSTAPTVIQPFTSTTTNVATSFSVTCRSLVLFTNAVFVVDTFDANSVLLNRQIFPITTEQYLAWNNNDSYIIDLVAKTLGFTVVPTTTPVVQSTP